MKRLAATLRWDVQLQIRNGFYHATAFVLIVWAAIIWRLPAIDLGWLLPALVLGNLMINTFYFMSGLVLLEKGEGTLAAQVVTPLRTWEYLAAKLITLGGLALAENILIVCLFYGFGFNLLPMIAAIILASVIYTLAGFIAVARFDSINEFLMPSILYTSLLTVPLMPYLARWESPLIYLHPVQAPLVLAEAAFQSVPMWQIAYGVFYSALWGFLLYRASLRTFHRFIIARAGAN